MEEIRRAIARHGNVWSLQTNSDMMDLYEPLHAQQAHKFETTVQVEKGLKYGDDARHRIDVYRPARALEGQGSSLPVVVFLHGGKRRTNWIGWPTKRVTVPALTVVSA